MRLRVVSAVIFLLHTTGALAQPHQSHGGETSVSEHAAYASNRGTPQDGSINDEGISLQSKEQPTHQRDPGQDAVDTARGILNAMVFPESRPFTELGFWEMLQKIVSEGLKLIIFNSPRSKEGQSSRAALEKNPKLLEASRLLESAASRNNRDAQYVLAEMNFHGNWTYPRNYSRAFQLYDTLATSTGNSTAQYMLGFMYATGIGGAVERDQGKALLYHTFAAMNGNIRSEMSVAYRKYVGIGTPRDCDSAVLYYKKVADRAMEYYRSGPPGGRVLPKDSYRWADEEGGVYGEGSYYSKYDRHGFKGTDASMEDVIEYLDLLAKKGEVIATYSLGKMYYEGSLTSTQNMRQAMKYFTLVTRRYWTKDGKVIPNHPVGVEKTAAKAAAHLGLMYLRGEGYDQDFSKALVWFKRARDLGNAMSQHYLGLMYLEGLGVPQDVVRAATYFKAAADQDYPLAQTRLGVLFLDQGDVMTAVQYFEMAARYGGIEPYYYLAEINDWGLGRERHCAVAAAYYKIVAEKAEVLHSAFAEANKAYEKRDYETAIIAAMMAAEQGYVDAQENVAYLLDDQRTFLPLTWLKLFLGIPEKSAFLRNSTLALVYYTRSAQQTTIDSFNIDSLVKMGDYYLKGTGTEASIDKAFTCYQSAAEGHRSAQALWNLGWMHENGYGVTQDFHMAKRYYDLALETNAEAYLPVKLSLMKLRVRSFWNTITGGKAHSIEPEPKQKQTRTFKEWVAEFISSYKSYNEDEYYDTRYKEQEERRHQQYQDNGMYDDLDGLDEMDLYEMLLILAVVAAMGILIYTRNQRLLARQVLPPAQPQQHQAQQGQGDHRGGEVQHANDVGGNRGGNREEDRGPGNDGPDNPAWTAGGIGH